MRAFEIHLNGRKLCTAGLGDDGALTAIVRSVRRPGQAVKGTRARRGTEDLGLDIGGYIPSTSEYLRWQAPRLRGGDEISIKIVQTNLPDKPSRRERTDSTQEGTALEAEKKRYVESAAKKFGWKIVKP